MQRRLGLALGGGAARGLAHVGVLQALTEAGISVDIITGTSAGAIVGALFAGGLTARQIAQIAERTTWAHLVRLTVPRHGLVNTAKLEDFLNTLLRGKTFAQLNVPFACVATDLLEESLEHNDEPATDVWAIGRNMVSLTPVHIDLTNHGLIETLEPWAAELSRR